MRLISMQHYFRKPLNLPATIVWAERLAFVYIAFAAYRVLDYAWQHPADNIDTALFLALVLFLLMTSCVFLATRRDLKLAYLLSIMLLSMPVGKFLVALPTANWDISVSDALLVILPTLSALAAAILLLLPASQVWVSQRRYELSQPLSPILETSLRTQVSPEVKPRLSSETQDNPSLQVGEAPKVGDPVYIPSELYVSHGEDDIRGGLTEIDSVVLTGRGYYWVTTKFNPSKQYNWSYLKEQHAELAREFGQNPPQNTPDYRSEFNDGWD